MATGAVAATASGAAAAIPAAASAGPPKRLLQVMFGGIAALAAAPAALRKALGGSRISEQNEARLAAAVYAGAGFVFALGLSVSGAADFLQDMSKAHHLQRIPCIFGGETNSTRPEPSNLA